MSSAGRMTQMMITASDNGGKVRTVRQPAKTWMNNAHSAIQPAASTGPDSQRCIALDDSKNVLPRARKGRLSLRARQRAPRVASEDGVQRIEHGNRLLDHQHVTASVQHHAAPLCEISGEALGLRRRRHPVL